MEKQANGKTVEGNAIQVPANGPTLRKALDSLIGTDGPDASEVGEITATGAGMIAQVRGERATFTVEDRKAFVMKNAGKVYQRLLTQELMDAGILRDDRAKGK
mgnify:CR=1 FL=1